LKQNSAVEAGKTPHFPHPNEGAKRVPSRVAPYGVG
jgi:hypothetical protein